MGCRYKFLGSALLDETISVPLRYRPVFYCKEKLVIVRKLGICLYMAFLTAVLIVELDDELIPVDTFTSSLPLIPCFFFGMIVQEIYFHVSHSSDRVGSEILILSENTGILAFLRRNEFDLP